MINTKEDFKGKTIKLPKNLSEKKFNKIKNKLERLGFDTERARYYEVGKYPYIAITNNNFSEVVMWSTEPNISKSRKQKKIDKYFKNLQNISIKEFLAEERGYFDLSSLRKSLPNDYSFEFTVKHFEKTFKYDIPRKYQSISTLRKETTCKYCKKNICILLSKGMENHDICPLCFNKGKNDTIKHHLFIEESKESKEGIYIKGKIKDYNPHLTIAGVEVPCCFGYRKTKEFKTAEEAIKWMCNNPMKEVSYEARETKFRGRFNNGVGLLGKLRYFEYVLDDDKDDDWIFDDDCLAKNFNSVNKNWINIREYEKTTPTFGLF